MKRAIRSFAPARVALLTACFVLGCDGSGESTADPLGISARACTPEAKCSACSSCFESCLCAGGSSARCADTCSLGESSDGGTADGEPPIRAPLTATISVEPFDIPPGEEFFRCQNFSNPFGKDVAVLKTESFMTSGSHHMFVFQQDGVTDGALEACGGLEFGPAVHTTQKSQQVFRYPDGIGRFLPASNGLRAQIHFLNPTSETIHVDLAVTLHATHLEDVPTLAGNVFINTLGISVAPHSTGSAHASCSVPKDINLLTASSHMHRHGVYYTARDSEGQLLYETNEWAEPEPWRFEPPRVIRAGSTIEVACEYENTTDSYLSFGESALTNEMCIFTGIYYPAEPGEAITCLF